MKPIHERYLAAAMSTSYVPIIHIHQMLDQVDAVKVYAYELPAFLWIRKHWSVR